MSGRSPADDEGVGKRVREEKLLKACAAQCENHTPPLPGRSDPPWSIEGPSLVMVLFGQWWAESVVSTVSAPPVKEADDSCDSKRRNARIAKEVRKRKGWMVAEGEFFWGRRWLLRIKRRNGWQQVQSPLAAAELLFSLLEEGATRRREDGKSNSVAGAASGTDRQTDRQQRLID